MTILSCLMITVPAVHILRDVNLGNKLFYLFFAFLIYIISIWRFLEEPLLTIKKNEMVALDPSHSKYELISSILNKYSSQKIEILTHESKRISARFLGTWKKKYIAISKGALSNLDDKELSVLLLHEIYHAHSGDSWKTGLPRLILLFSVIIVGGVFIISYPNWMVVAGNSALMSLILVTFSFFDIILLSLGLIYIYRIREFLADNFALQNLPDITHIASLFFKIDMTSKSESSTRYFLHTPKIRMFSFHPSGAERLKTLENPSGFAQKEYQNLSIITGIFIASLTSYAGDLKQALNFTMPVYIILGSLLLSIISFNNKQDKSFSFHLINGLTFSGLLAISTNLTVIIFTMPWNLFGLLPPVTSSGNITTFPIEFVSKYTALNAFYLLLDNFIIIIISSLAMHVIMSIYQKIINQAGSYSVVTISWLLWAPIGLWLSYYWVSYLGDFNLKTQAILMAMVSISALSIFLAGIIFLWGILKPRKELSNE